LQSLVDLSIEKSWGDALIGAARETAIPIEQFPPQCPWTFTQIMDDDFWPEASADTH